MIANRHNTNYVPFTLLTRILCNIPCTHTSSFTSSLVEVALSIDRLILCKCEHDGIRHFYIVSLPSHHHHHHQVLLHHFVSVTPIQQKLWISLLKAYNVKLKYSKIPRVHNIYIVYYVILKIPSHKSLPLSTKHYSIQTICNGCSYS